MLLDTMANIPRLLKRYVEMSTGHLFDDNYNVIFNAILDDELRLQMFDNYRASRDFYKGKRMIAKSI